MIGERRDLPVGRLPRKSSTKTCDRINSRHRCSQCIKGNGKFYISTSEDGTITRIREKREGSFERLAPCEKNMI